MKKTFIFLLIFLFLTEHSISQVVLTNASNGYVSGYSSWIYYNWWNNAGYYPVSANYTNASGETWDFHEMTYIASERYDYNYCWFDSAKVAVPDVGCVLNTDDYAVINGDNTFVYNVPDTVMKFPLHLGDHFATSYFAINPSSSPSSFRTVYGSNATVVDARGTLILPYATFENVLRLKIVTYFTDTFHSTADTIYRAKRVQYKWYSPVQREYLMIIDSSYTFNTRFGTSYEERIMSGYALSQPLAVNSLSTNFGDLNIYPNPATTTLTIAGDGITTISICNLLGQQVYNRPCSSSKVQVDVSSLPDGAYFIKVNGSETRWFMKK